MAIMECVHIAWNGCIIGTRANWVTRLVLYKEIYVVCVLSMHNNACLAIFLEMVEFV